MGSVLFLLIKRTVPAPLSGLQVQS